VLTFPAEALEEDGGPSTLVAIVVRVAGGSEDVWLHADDGLGDLEAPLRPPPPPPPPGVRAKLLAERVATGEAQEGMNLYSRYCQVHDALGEAMADPGPGSAAVILTWLRLSASRQLSWYDGGNYQGKDMAHMQKSLATAMAAHVRGEGLKVGCCSLRVPLRVCCCPVRASRRRQGRKRSSENTEAQRKHNHQQSIVCGLQKRAAQGHLQGTRGAASSNGKHQPMSAWLVWGSSC
jgi:hypothetical protein